MDGLLLKVVPILHEDLQHKCQQLRRQVQITLKPWYNNVMG
jgi:hypothetical protein